MNFLTVVLKSPLIEYLISVLPTLNSAGLEILVSNFNVFHLWDTGLFPLNKKVRMLHGQFGLFMLLNQKNKKGLFYLLEWFIPLTNSKWAVAT